MLCTGVSEANQEELDDRIMLNVQKTVSMLIRNKALEKDLEALKKRLPSIKKTC